MKFNFRLDLNTIVLLLLIVVFSAIIFYNIKKHTIIEGVEGASTLQEAIDKLEEEETTLDRYKLNEKDFTTAKNNLSSQQTKVGSETKNIKDTVYLIDPSIILPNLHIMDAQRAVSQTTLDTYESAIDRIIKEMDYDDSLDNQSILTKITNTVKTQTDLVDKLKSALETSVTFTIDTPIEATDGGAVITITNSSIVPPPSYTVKESAGVLQLAATTNTSTQGKTILTVTGLTNGKSYKFIVKADYAGIKTFESPVTQAVIPRGKPSITAVGSTGGAKITITPPSIVEPTSYTIKTTSTSTKPVADITLTPPTLTKDIGNLDNNILYTFSVIANYSDNGKSSPATATATPRNSPTGTGAKGVGNGTATITITEPTGSVKPVAYSVYGNVENNTSITAPKKLVSYPETKAEFSELGDHVYLFYIIAIYSDESTSSAYAVGSVTVKNVLKPTLKIIPTDSGATLELTNNNSDENVSKYYISVYKKDTTPIVWSSTTKADSKYDITGLVNGTKYTISVIAKYSNYSSDKIESGDVIPFRLTGTQLKSMIKVDKTAVNMSFYINTPSSAMKSFSIKIRNGTNEGKTKELTITPAMIKAKVSGTLSWGPQQSNKKYYFDITINFTDGKSEKVLINEPYTTNPIPEIRSRKIPDGLLIYVSSGELDYKYMSSISAKMKGVDAISANKTSSGLELTIPTVLLTTKGTLFDISVTYTDGQVYTLSSVTLKKS